MRHVVTFEEIWYTGERTVMSLMNFQSSVSRMLLHWGFNRSGNRRCSAKKPILAAVLFALLFYALVAAGFPIAAWAADTNVSDQPRDPSLSVSATGVYQFPTNLDSGGKMKVMNYQFSAGLRKQLSKDLGLRLGLTYALDDYHFSGHMAFPGRTYWDQVHRLGGAVALQYDFTDRWDITIAPSVEFSGESGARIGKSLIYGGYIATSYDFDPTLTLGVGVGTYFGIEKTSVFPYIVVNWKITDRLKLTNPFTTSPAGPAGLELSYKLDPKWEVGVGGAYRSSRFRLDEDFPAWNGVGEYRRIPIFARLSYKACPSFTIDLYGGASFMNKVWQYDQNGNELSATKADAAPLIGLTLKASF